MRQSQFRFILQQGFEATNASEGLYAALMVQPRIVGGLVALGVLFHSAWVFLVLSAVLWWSTLVPAQNPFDAIANHFVARPRGIPPLGIAPGPRRFAQGMSATVTLAIGAALLVGAERTVWLLEGLRSSRWWPWCSEISVKGHMCTTPCEACCILAHVPGPARLFDSLDGRSQP